MTSTLAMKISWRSVYSVTFGSSRLSNPLPASCRRFRHHHQKLEFKTLDGAVDTNSAFYQSNLQHNSKLSEQLKHALKIATSGGSAKAIERHTVTNKKLLVNDRLALLFDDMSDVLELSPLAGLGMKYGDIPRGGVVTVIGRIHGIHCLVFANDATVKAGTIYPIALKKQIRCLEIALQNGIPVVSIVDSGGAFLPLQAEIFPDRLTGGRTFWGQAILNSLDIPQLAIVCGSCTAGAAYIPTMAQESIIVDKIGTVFLAGPPLVKAALGEVISPDDLGGARLHCSVSGCTDYFAPTEQEAFELGRASVATFNINPVQPNASFKEPLFDPNELPGIIPVDRAVQLDIYKVIARLVDGSLFHEFKAEYGKAIVAGFCYIAGYLVGVVANNGAMTSDAALKAAHFVQLCSQRDVPIVFLQNVTSYSTNGETSDNLQTGFANGELLRNQAKLMSSVACSGVPLFTVVVGNSFGVESYMMGGRSFSPRFLFCWPNARVCITEPDQLAQAIVEDAVSSGQLTEDKVDEKLVELKERYRKQAEALYSTTNAWDDGIIQPQDTRQILVRCLEIANQNPTYRSRSSPAQSAVIRM